MLYLTVGALVGRVGTEVGLPTGCPEGRQEGCVVGNLMGCRDGCWKDGERSVVIDSINIQSRTGVVLGVIV